MTVVCVDPRTDPLWSEFICNAPSSVFHSPAWLQVLSDTYSWEPKAYVVMDDQGQPRGGLPFCRISDIFGSRIVALPFSDYCDPLVPDQQAWQLLTTPLFSDACPVVLRCLHNKLR